MKKTLGMLVVLMFAASMYTSADETYTTNAEIVSTGGTAPVIEYAWVLPDEDSAPGTQLIPDAGAERTDIYSCIVVSDADGRDDIQDVWIDLYHPENNYTNESLTQKYQVHAHKLDLATDHETIELCIESARQNGLITDDDADLEGVEGMGLYYWILQQPGWYMYKVDLPMLYHQPAGWYRGDIAATDTIGNTGHLDVAQYFQWVPTVILETDIGSSLDFGTIQKGVTKYVQGDKDMGTGGPTVRNQGNVPIGLTLINTPMVGVNEGKMITEFDVQFRSVSQVYNADEMLLIPKTVRNCHTEKIDFSVHPGTVLPIDSYVGSMTLGAYDGSEMAEDSPAEIMTAPLAP